ncbi:MAG: hypothetical protein HW389_741 [Bacteroidetes bacterium]|nr:hypothetical protein [Bacteroidota bacterium]
MDLWQLKKGAVVKLESGASATVLAPTKDGQWIRVQYLESPENPMLRGTEDLCAEHEIKGIAGQPSVKRSK